MSQDELRAEWEYRFDERAAILAHNRELTREERLLCLREADEALANLVRKTP